MARRRCYRGEITTSQADRMPIHNSILRAIQYPWSFVAALDSGVDDPQPLCHRDALARHASMTRLRPLSGDDTLVTDIESAGE